MAENEYEILDEGNDSPLIEPTKEVKKDEDSKKEEKKEEEDEKEILIYEAQKVIK